MRDGLRRKVVQLLGQPQTNMQQSNGITTQVFTHSFTSYSRHLIDTQVLSMEYDAAGKVTKTSLTTSQSTW